MFKNVLVHLRGTEGDAPALAAALALASPFAGHLDCLFVKPVFRGTISLVYDEDTPPSFMMEALRSFKEERRKAAQHATEAFETFCAREGISPGKGREGPPRVGAAFGVGNGPDLEKLVTRGRYHDLVVVKGGPVEAGGMGPSDVGRLVLSVGRPVLLAPSAAAGKIRTIVIAWKDTPEAARALTAATPLLAKAEKVFVVNVGEEDEPQSDCQGVVEHLRWHGVSALAHHIDPRGRNAADTMLEAARAENADLLVMGAYGRTRLAETLFGGFTHTILEDASIPILMFR